MTEKEVEVSQESIDKAEELFKITTDDVAKPAENVTKADDNDEDEESMKKALDEAKGKVKELEMKIGARAGLKQDAATVGNPDEDGGAVMTKAEKDELAKAKEIKPNVVTKIEDTFGKAETSDLIKAEFSELSENLVKGVSDKLQAVGELYLTQKDAQDEVDEKLEGFSKALEGIQESLDEIANAPVTGRRGIITKASVERFKEENGDDAKVLSQSANRSQIVDLLYEKSGLVKGENIDDQLVKAMQDMEGVGQFSDPTIPALLKKEYNIHIVN